MTKQRGSTARGVRDSGFSSESGLNENGSVLIISHLPLNLLLNSGLNMIKMIKMIETIEMVEMIETVR